MATEAMHAPKRRVSPRPPPTVVTTPLMCSSSRSRHTGQVGSSVCPGGASMVAAASRSPVATSMSLTYTSLRRHGSGAGSVGAAATGCVQGRPGSSSNSSSCCTARHGWRQAWCRSGAVGAAGGVHCWLRLGACIAGCGWGRALLGAAWGVRCWVRLGACSAGCGWGRALRGAGGARLQRISGSRDEKGLPLKSAWKLSALSWVSKVSRTMHTLRPVPSLRCSAARWVGGAHSERGGWQPAAMTSAPPPPTHSGPNGLPDTWASGCVVRSAPPQHAHLLDVLQVGPTKGAEVGDRHVSGDGQAAQRGRQRLRRRCLRCGRGGHWLFMRCMWVEL